ncbi:MAG: histidinol-phosphatase HisJ family protein [Actinobacteria bacterium]|nr:MAG: histidinol-phosphatase HisJ family protein [Actinomycetota bacterium]
MIVDYHMHLRNERGEIAHDAASIDPFVETARSVGVDEIGFTEHVYYFRQTRPLWTVPYHVERCVYDIEDYVAAVVAAKERGLPVKLGLEVDYVPGREKETQALLEPYPWDYLLGSIHWLDDLSTDSEPRLIDELGVEAGWRRYFEALGGAARSRLFDSLSHPDVIKIFDVRPDRPAVEEMHKAFATAVAESGIALEVSTAGLHKPVGELYPDPHLLGAAHARGVPVTLASDAHHPELVGRDFDRARELLISASYDTITVFEQRRARQEPLG